MRRVVVLVWLVALWVVLWRDLSLANVVSGVAVAGFVTSVFPLRPPASRRHHVRPLALLTFAGYFVWQLLVSNITVARMILSPRPRVRTGIVALPVPGSSDLITTMVANAITLTPGTMTLEVSDDRRTLYVHVLDATDVDAVRARLRGLLHRALRAVGTDEDLAAVEGLSPETGTSVDQEVDGSRTGYGN